MSSKLERYLKLADRRLNIEYRANPMPSAPKALRAPFTWQLVFAAGAELMNAMTCTKPVTSNSAYKAHFWSAPPAANAHRNFFQQAGYFLRMAQNRMWFIRLLEPFDFVIR